MLNDIEVYCYTWGLEINVNKTKSSFFKKGSRRTKYDFCLYNEIENVSPFKYLGVYFFKNGRWNRNQKHIADHALKTLHRLCSIIYQSEFKTVDKFTLFDNLVVSVLNYASEVWGINDGKDIETRGPMVL